MGKIYPLLYQASVSQTGNGSGVRVWSALQTSWLTSSNKVSVACLLTQHPTAHFCFTSSSAATFGNLSLCAGPRPHPTPGVEEHGQEPPAASLHAVPSPCLRDESCFCGRNVGIKNKLLQILARSVVTQSGATGGEGCIELDSRDSWKERTCNFLVCFCLQPTWWAAYGFQMLGHS